MQIFALMTIYNKPVEESVLYQFLCRAKEIVVVVCDNSTEKNQNRDVVERNGGHYIAMGENAGLARAYNRGITKIFKLGGQDKDYVCLFDDDSVLEDNYFETLREIVFRDAGMLYLPVVEDGNGIMSPAVLPHLYCRRIKNSGELLKTPRRKLTGINSGMAVQLAVYKGFSYDERYFMDYIDHAFILEMRRRGIYPKLMDTHIRQNFSAVVDDGRTALGRFERQRRDLKLFYEGRTCGRAAYFYVVAKKRLKLFLKHRHFYMLYK